MTTADHLDDEQLTALADGDGGTDERAHLEGCDRCRTRADALASAAALVATPPPVPSDADRDAAVTAALRAAERPVALRRPARRRAPAWVAPVAAVVVLLALLAAVVPRLETGRGDDDDTAASGRGAARAESADDAATGAGGGGTVQQDDALRSAAPGAVDLGAVDEEGELARRVDDALGSQAAAEATAPASAAPCEAAVRTLSPPLGPLRLRASVVWRGQDAEVVSDGARAVVFATGGCSVLATVDVP